MTYPEPSGLSWSTPVVGLARRIRILPALSPRHFLSAIMSSILALALWVGGSPLAQAEALLLGDVEQGAQFHAEKCTSCHIARMGGDGNEIYTRRDRRIQTIEGLMQQVQFCNANIRSGFTPGQLDDIVAYLNKNFYQFDD